MNEDTRLDDTQAIREEARAILDHGLYDYADRSNIAFDWDWLLDPLERANRWFQDLLSQAPAGTATVISIVLVVVLFGLLGHIIYSFIRASRLRQEPVELTIDDKPLAAEELVDKANDLAGQGNYVDASRALYEASLTLLEDKRRGRVRRGLTGNEYLRTFKAPWVVENLRVFVYLINWKWYRARAFDANDYAQCAQAFENIRTRLQETP